MLSCGKSSDNRESDLLNILSENPCKNTRSADIFYCEGKNAANCSSEKPEDYIGISNKPLVVFSWLRQIPYSRENKSGLIHYYFRSMPQCSISIRSTGLRKGNSSSLKCLGRTLCGIDTLVYTLHENMKVNFFGTCPT